LKTGKFCSGYTDVGKRDNEGDGKPEILKIGTPKCFKDDGYGPLKEFQIPISFTEAYSYQIASPVPTTFGKLALSLGSNGALYYDKSPAFDVESFSFFVWYNPGPIDAHTSGIFALHTNGAQLNTGFSFTSKKHLNSSLQISLTQNF
jgi:hypothetical protein